VVDSGISISVGPADSVSGEVDRGSRSSNENGSEFGSDTFNGLESFDEFDWFGAESADSLEWLDSETWFAFKFPTFEFTTFELESDIL